MKIMTLFTAALIAAALSQGSATARAEVAPEHAYVTVTFGAVAMQVPVALAVQLCPGTGIEELARATESANGVACDIPNEEYASQGISDDRRGE
jgi:hypothetical protein